MTPYRTRFTLLVALSFITLSGVRAQTTKPSTDSPAPNSGNEQAITLSEFTVSSGSEQGYIASESVTGTRVATKIKDLPFSVSVVTKEFMRDFDFFDLGKDMVYTASLNGVDSQGNSN